MSTSSEQSCPRCGEPIAAQGRSALLMCSACGFIPGVTPADEPVVRAQGDAGETVGTAVRVPRQITYIGDLSLRARSLYESGAMAAERGALTEALDNFQDAIGIEPEFVDAHLAIARITNDPALQKEHLDAALAYDPGNAEALRLWMVLRGQLTPEGAERAVRDEAPEMRQADGPVRAQTVVLICPVCSGHMTVDDETGQTVCRFCGHVAVQRERTEVGGHSLGAALLARKAEPVRWVIGERLLHCNNCGAEQVLAATTLSQHCPFCGSNHVIEQDAAGSFIQPDGVIPFALDERAVVARLKAALDTPLEKLSNLLDENRVKSAIINGMFVPFWVFDVVVQIRRSVKQRDGSFTNRWAAVQPPRVEIFNDALFNLPILGIREIDDELTGRIAGFEFSNVRPYEAGLLAARPATLYDVDFDAASLRARSLASQHMRDKHQLPTREGDEVSTIFTQVQSMSFSLLLLPIFVASMKERDGDLRPALVNGHTGQVALGKSRKPG